MKGYENYNIIGEYKNYTIHGTPYVYKENDLVTYHGKSYVATKTIKEITPDKGSDFGWSELEDNRSIQFSTGTEPHNDPQPGDEWYDTTNGILLKYIDDNDTQQWVQI